MAKKNPKAVETFEKKSSYPGFISAEDLRNQIGENKTSDIHQKVYSIINGIYYELKSGRPSNYGFGYSYSGSKPGKVTRMYWDKSKVDAIRDEFENSGYNVIVETKNVCNNPTGTIYYKIIISI